MTGWPRWPALDPRRAEIDQTLDEFCARAGGNAASLVRRLVPHAGWIYSVAAAVLGRVQIPARIIIFCPRPTSARAAWAVAPYGNG